MNYQLRPLTATDEPLLWELLYQAVQPKQGHPTPPRDIVRQPQLARHVEGWGRPEDTGFVAHDTMQGHLLGAVWLRQPGDQPQRDAPLELAFVVKPGQRGRGIGTALLTQLVRANPERLGNFDQFGGRQTDLATLRKVWVQSRGTNARRSRDETGSMKNGVMEYPSITPSLHHSITPSPLPLRMKRALISICLTSLLALAPLPALAAPTVFVVRHAEKAQTAGTDPELTTAGKARARRLAEVLKDAEIGAIYATEFKRTQQTAAPLAKKIGIPVTVVGAKQTALLVSKLRGSKMNAVVVGHGNTIPGLIQALGITTPVAIGENDYDNLFVVVLRPSPRLVRLHYP